MTKTPPAATHPPTPTKTSAAAPRAGRSFQPLKGSPRRTASFAATLRREAPRSGPHKSHSPSSSLGTRPSAPRRPPADIPPEREQGRLEAPPRHVRRDPEPLPEDGLLHLPPPIVLPPPSSAPAVAGANPAWERAEAAALAQQVLSHVRVGANGEVRLGLGGIFAGTEVRLRLEGGRVVPTLVADDPQLLGGLAARLERELADRGLETEPVRIERG